MTNGSKVFNCVCILSLSLALTGCQTIRSPGTASQFADSVRETPVDVVRAHLLAMHDPTVFESLAAPVVGISGGEGADRIWYRNAEFTVRQRQENPAPPHRVIDLQTHFLDKALAAVIARYTTADRSVTCRAIYTLSRESGEWRIVSLVFETQLTQFLHRDQCRARD